MPDSRRLVFLGTPEISVGPLRALHAAGHEVALVVTNADRRRGRGGATSPSPVKAAALELGLPVSHRVDDVIDSGAELGVVVAFGRLIRPHVLAAIPMVNLHFSLLPRWRGAAPVERALLAGDTETGVCVMAVDETLDTGDVFAREVVPIGPETTADELRTLLAERGSELLTRLLAEPELPPGQPQHGEVTYAAKIEPGEWELDWSQPAVDAHRWIRCGRARTTFRGRRLGVAAARLADIADIAGGAPGVLVDSAAGVVATGTAGVRLATVQPEGRRPMPWSDFANGARPRPGELFGVAAPDAMGDPGP